MGCQARRVGCVPGILGNPLIEKFPRAAFRRSGYDGRPAPLVAAASAFEAALLPIGEDWGAVLLDILLEDDNLCIRRAAAGGAGEVAEACLARELALLQRIGALTLPDLVGGLPDADRLLQQMLPPSWKAQTQNYTAAYLSRCAEVGRKGFGMFARCHVFTLEDGHLTPVRYPDPQRLSQLPGYERERQKVIDNTKALLAGKPAANVLLYGDAGTGKSSTVKAIANEFAAEGLRLVEIKKHQLYQLPALMDELAQNPLKFILFMTT